MYYHSKERKADGASKESDAGVGAYMNSIKEVKLLDRAEEQALAKQIEQHTKSLHRILFANEYFIRAAAHTFKRVRQKKLFARGVVKGGGKKEAVVRNLLCKNLEAVQKILHLNRDDFERILSRGVFQEESKTRPSLTKKEFRSEIMERITERRAIGSKLLVAVSFRVEALTPMITSFEQLVQRSIICRDKLRLMQREADPRAWENQRAELRALVRQLGDVPSSARRALTSIQGCLKELNAARDTMIVSNTPLVINIARSSYAGGAELLDLIQAGNLGLVKAVDTFDPKEGTKLSTYATRLIEQSIRRLTESGGGAVRRTSYAFALAAQVEKVQTALGHELGRAPTLSEVTAELNSSKRSASADTKVMKRTNAFTEADIVAVLRRETTSLDEVMVAVDQQFAVPPHDHLADAERVEREQIILTLKNLLEKLPERKQQVITLRLGLHGGGKMKLKDVGRLLGITTERTRQIEQSAFKQLRAEYSRQFSVPDTDQSS
jgi:RNA polymerase sigma factor (sigma-70 family)